MKRFVLFGGMTFYPVGGWEDKIDTFDRMVDAVAEAERLLAKDPWLMEGAGIEWAHVVDTKREGYLNIVWTGKKEKGK